MANPNDEIREKILQYFYDRNQNATSKYLVQSSDERHIVLFAGSRLGLRLMAAVVLAPPHIVDRDEGRAIDVLSALRGHSRA